MSHWFPTGPETSISKGPRELNKAHISKDLMNFDMYGGTKRVICKSFRCELNS